jgi:ribonuclease HI
MASHDSTPSGYVKIEGMVIPLFGVQPFDVVERKFRDLVLLKDWATLTPPLGDDASIADHVAWQPITFRDAHIHQGIALLNSLCDEFDRELVEAEPATVIARLQVLKAKYKGDEAAQFVQLSKEWDSFTYLPPESIATYISRGIRLRTQLHNVGQRHSETSLCVKLLNNLPKEYDITVQVFYQTQRNLANVKLTAIRPPLQQRENQLQLAKSNASQSDALALQASGKRGRRNKFRGRGKRQQEQLQPNHEQMKKGQHSERGRQSSARGRGGRQPQHGNRIKGACWNCGKIGHKSEDCWAAKKNGGSSQQAAANAVTASTQPRRQVRFDLQEGELQDFAPGTAAQGRAQRTSEDAHAYAVAGGHYTGVSYPEHVHTSLLDSAADFHMTPFGALLHNVRPLSKTVTVASKHTLSAIGIGDLYVESKLPDGNVRMLIIPDVWHVPGLIGTLISVKRLQANGSWAVIKNDSISYFDRSDKLAFVAYEGDHGYVPHWRIAAPKSKEAYALLAKAPKEDALLWHARLGHASHDVLHAMVKDNHVTGIKISPSSIAEFKEHICPVCIQAKHQRMPYRSSCNDIPANGTYISSDITGPYQLKSLGGNIYLQMSVDHGSDLWDVRLLKAKSDVESNIPEVLAWFKTQTGNACKYFRSDNGGEYVNEVLGTYFAENGITHYTSLAYEHEQNGKAENAIKHCNNLGRALLLHSGLPLQLWGEAVSHAAYLHNITYSKTTGSTPWKLFYGVTPNLSDLRTFGCIAYYRVPDELRQKLDPKSKLGYYLGPASKSKASRILVKDARGRLAVKLCRDVITVENYLTHPNVPAMQFFKFDSHVAPPSMEEAHPGEQSMPREPSAAPLRDEAGLPESQERLQNTLTPPLEVTNSGGVLPGSQLTRQKIPALGNEYTESVAEYPGGELDQVGQSPSLLRAGPPHGVRVGETTSLSGRDFPQPTVRVLSSGGASQPIKRMRFEADAAYAQYVKTTLEPLDDALAHAVIESHDDDYEPVDYWDAMECHQHERWREATKSEHDSLDENHTWEWVKREPGMKVIPCRHIYKIKRDADGNISRYKCRLVAGGHRQKYGVDYDETFAPVSSSISQRLLLSKAAYEKGKPLQLDIKTAFLHGEIDCDVYMEVPPGYEVDGKQYVCKLTKCLYGLKQAPRAWNEKLTELLTKLDFKPCPADACLWYGYPEGELTLITVVVDDNLLYCHNLQIALRIKDKILAVFKGTWSFAAWYCGMKINWLRDGTCILTQKAHIEKMLKEHGLESCREHSVPAPPGFKFTKKGHSLDVTTHAYSALVGSLLYIAGHTRPDIMQVVSRFAKYNAFPTQEMWDGLVYLCGYLRSTINYGLQLGRKKEHTVMYTDADFAMDPDDRRSQTGWVFLVHGSAVSWQSKCQATVAASNTEAEYQAISMAARECLWLRQLLPIFHIPAKTITILSDSMGAIDALKNPHITKRSKHIDVIHHFVRERCARGELRLQYVATAKNIADLFTKPLPRQKHEWCCLKLGVVPLP